MIGAPSHVTREDIPIGPQVLEAARDLQYQVYKNR